MLNLSISLMKVMHCMWLVISILPDTHVFNLLQLKLYEALPPSSLSRPKHSKSNLTNFDLAGVLCRMPNAKHQNAECQMHCLLVV